MRIVARGFWKRTGVLAILGACASAQAQFDPSVILGIKALRDANLVRGSIPTNPLQPTGFPGLEEKRPDEDVASQSFRVINADEQETLGVSHYILRGNVEFEARGFHVRSDEAEIDTKTQIGTLTGHVLITGNDTNVYGEKVIVDFGKETYIAERAETQFSPDQLQNRLTDKLYVKGKLSSGNRLLTHTQDGDFTTCNLEHPHYHIDARDIDFRTGRRIVLRDSKVIIFDRTILKIPYLSIPLDDRSSRYTPYIGRTPDEGYFVKLAIAVPVKSGALLTREDFMQKKGVGLGADYLYNAPSLSGVARIYRIFGPGDTTTFSNDHRQAFRWGSAQLSNDYQENNYLVASKQTLLTTRGAVTYNGFLGKGAIDHFTLNRTSNDATSYSSLSQTLAVQDTRRIGTGRTDTQISLLNTANKSNGATVSEAERIQVRFLGTQDAGPGTASLQYQRSIPVGGTAQFIGSSDLTPVLSYESDSRRLFGTQTGRDIPFKTSFSYGQYSDPRRGSQVERTAFNFAFNKSTPSNQRFTADTATNFRQGIYSDDTAQYLLGLNENLRYRLGGDTGINLRYAYLRPYGYTPLSIDNAGQTNLVTTDINVRPIRSVLLGAQTGYDIQREKASQIAWQQVGIRSEWTPRPGIVARGLYTYDTYQQAFSQLRFDFSAIGREARLNLNAQYDGIQHTFSTVNGSIDGIRLGRTKIAAVFSYNGYLRKFESKQFAFTYDLHCAEAVLAIQENDTGFRPGRQVFLLLRLKALPFDLPFGTGTRGQGLGFGNGTSF